MENPSVPIPTASPGNPSATTPPPPERSEKEKFSTEETNFLKTHLPAFEALYCRLKEQGTGPRATGLVKGRKKDWIISNVFPEFVEKFSSHQNGGPQLESLQAARYVLSGMWSLLTWQ